MENSDIYLVSRVYTSPKSDMSERSKGVGVEILSASLLSKYSVHLQYLYMNHLSQQCKLNIHKLFFFFVQSIYVFIDWQRSQIE